MNIMGFFDASGHHEGSPVLSVAGFLGRPDDWGAFEHLWRKELDAWQLESFHMKDFAHAKGPYKDWSEGTRRVRLGRLLQIILQTSMASVGLAIPLADYRASIAGPAGLLSGGPFGLGVSLCFQTVAGMVKGLSGNPHVAYVFEIGDPGYGQVMKIYQDNYNDPAQRWNLRLLSLKFEDKNRFVPLQAADILAYELHRRWPQERLRPRPDARYPLRALATQPHSWGYPDADELRKLAEPIMLGPEHSTGTWQKSELSDRPTRRSRRRPKRDR